ncbi:glycoside hydrolase family 127 protein [Streptomyces oryzae]|uniref:glycoside hydrolase family 127 protein n=1 Tax=Streptomyces oryzae TaxID=1434886 RepID=UPI0027DD13B4|nr:beta-L-arabinofuranosidase domain-containing protein [Streptomyces oryzae]
MRRRTVVATAAGLTAAGLSAAAVAAVPARAATPRTGGTSIDTAAAFPLSDVALHDGPFRDNQARNSAYLRDVDPDRLLHTFRRNVGLPSTAEPCGGWEAPDVELRGHSLGHLLSGLALTYANTGEQRLRDKGALIVRELAACQARAAEAGYHEGYLSAFPESFLDRLEAGEKVWAPYYTLHKIMAGLLDQYALAGNKQALRVLNAQAGWLDRRTAGLDHAHMQRVLETEFGGMNEVLVNLAAATGASRWLDVAERFSHEAVFQPLERGEDRLAGLHANTQIPKMTGAQRLHEEGRGSGGYGRVAANFWRIVTDHHTYVIGGNSNNEAFHAPDAIAAQLGPTTCENCNSYNMLKLTRLLHFRSPERIQLLDYYERTLFNQMLGEQDPESAHGFNIYYTGLQPGAYKAQPSFMGDDPEAYSTDYDNFSCDHGTGMETHAKFADTIYSRATGDDAALFVNLFIPSRLNWRAHGIVWDQTTRFPDTPATTLTVHSGRARHALHLRIPGWAHGARVRVNDEADAPADPGTWFTVPERDWSRGDRVRLSLPMRLRLEATADDPQVQAVCYGPVVLAGQYGPRAGEEETPMPRLDPDSVRPTEEDGLRFTARADGRNVTLLPVSRTHHERYVVYWRVDS